MSGLAVTSPNPTSGAPCTVNWTPESGDAAVFSLELVNVVFHNTFALANNVQTSSGQVNVTIPIVPADSYTIEAVQINDVNSVIATSGSFNIGATITSTSSGSSTSSGLSRASGSGSSASTAGSTSTPSVSSASSSSSSNSSPSASASSFNGNGNGALGTRINSGSVGSIAAAVVGIVAGAVLSDFRLWIFDFWTPRQ
ncbi:hypothetical protein BGY98DRAFT_1092467 [Russula aff. rugulosa BPL654]|nr:hypothetical protein BGY98DRAFT_1092467 [Russula aff. rugulosa BPL654]